MLIGVPTEVKDHEFRVALTPAGAMDLIRRGHDVVVQSGAGRGSGFADGDYTQAGARTVESARDAWSADLVLKVKEPQPQEFDLMQRGQILFTYLHLAAEAQCARELQQRGITAIAYETVTGPKGLPLLAPMSEVAGRLAASGRGLSPHAGSGRLGNSHRRSSRGTCRQGRGDRGWNSR